MSGKDVPVVPKKFNTEIVTSHKLAITVLIRNFILYRDSHEFKDMQDTSLRCKHRRDFCVLILRLLQSPDLPLTDFRNLLRNDKYVVPGLVLESFDQSLSKLHTVGIEGLLDIVDTLGSILASDRSDSISENKSVLESGVNFIAKISIVGYFIRRFIIAFDRLNFSEVTRLFEEFQSYYQEGQRNENVVTREEEEIIWYSNREQWSKRQAELFIATQAALLSNNKEKALPPPELQNKITSILKSNPDLSGAHFLSYLNYLRVNEFCGALDCLTHCFDRNTDPDVKCFNDEKSKRHRFAALNLAILHYNFGHIEEALSALKESIKISQEANDNVCLQHALSWLYRLTTVNKGQLIIHCILKSSELSLSYTASLGLQTFGQYCCLHTGKTYDIYETLVKSDMINCQHNYKDLISNNYAMRSSLWQLYGKTEMSSLWSQLLLYQNMDSTSPTKTYYGEGFCLAICNIANHLMLQGEYVLVNCILDFAKARFPDEPNSHIWMLCESLFIFTRALYRENFTEAESAAQKIMVFDKRESYLRLAEVYFYKRDYIEADNFVQMLLTEHEEDTAYKFNDNFYYIRAKILKAEIQFASSYPDWVPTGVISILNNCLTEFQMSQLDYQSALIHLQIANCMLVIGLTSQAVAILDQCLVQILAHGGCYDRARATLLYAKCLVADSSKLGMSKRSSIISNCAQLLENVKIEFMKVEAYSRVKDVLYLQAKLYNFLGMKLERNRCSREYRILDEEYVTKNPYTLLKYV